jgi:hypothetical protein
MLDEKKDIFMFGVGTYAKRRRIKYMRVIIRSHLPIEAR